MGVVIFFMSSVNLQAWYLPHVHCQRVVGSMYYSQVFCATQLIILVLHNDVITWSFMNRPFFIHELKIITIERHRELKVVP